jgi:hypothetical protein
MNCQLILTNKVCAAVLLLWVMEAILHSMFIFDFTSLKNYHLCINNTQVLFLLLVEILIYTVKPVLRGQRSHLTQRKSGFLRQVTS